jgi:ribosomal protein S27AE
MATTDEYGSTPLSTLRAHYERTRRLCGECGYVDDDADWRAVTTGRTVRYVHECPSCGATARQVVRLTGRGRTRER